MDLAAKKAQLKIQTVDEKIQNTFGPNPCTNLKLVDDTGELLELICDSKRCPDCSPRKQATMQLQLAHTFGVNAYIHRYATTAEAATITARLKKEAQRAGDVLLYQNVGDDYTGAILITDRPQHGHQARTNLMDWMKRIIQSWLYGDNRIRRSQAIGRLSLLTYKRRVKVGTSPWQRLTARFVSVRERLLEAEIKRRDELVAEVGWHVWEGDTRIESSISAWSVTDA